MSPALCMFRVSENAAATADMDADTQTDEPASLAMD